MGSQQRRVSLAERVKGAYDLARKGVPPEEAWQITLEALYPAGKKLRNQEIHTCPKWAFCILCHNGNLKEVSSGSCPNAENEPSANYALDALRLLKADHSLASRSSELRQRVFGRKETPDYRTPNEEHSVVLYLWNSGVIDKT